MKKVCVLMVFVGLCLCSVATAQTEVKHLGEICLKLSPIVGGPETLHIGVLSYGTDTFPLHGKIRTSVGSETVSIPLQGTAVIYDSTIEMTINSSSLTLGPFAATYSIKVNLLTLLGNFNALKHEHSPFMLPEPVNIVSGGTVTVLACP